MQRNLLRRVETVFPVVTPGMRDHVEEILDWFWRDNVKARKMLPDGTYQPLVTKEPPFDAQAEFLADAQRRRKARQAAAAESQ
jgi:polyphosphate kinase